LEERWIEEELEEMRNEEVEARRIAAEELEARQIAEELEARRLTEELGAKRIAGEELKGEEQEHKAKQMKKEEEQL